jgi:hypothetical protein
MKIIYIDHKSQRYDTAGDYLKINNEWVFHISKLSKHRYNLCVTLHEIIECYLCYWFDIKEPDIMSFDLDYEYRRKKGLNCKYGCKITELSEPGFDKHAPYYFFHLIATVFEWLFSKLLFVSWKKYSDDVNNL